MRQQAANEVLTWSLVGSTLTEAVGVVCRLRPLVPEPLPHLPPNYTGRNLIVNLNCLKNIKHTDNSEFSWQSNT